MNILDQAAEKPDVSEYIKLLETDGYCRIPQVYSPDQISIAKRKIEAIFDEYMNKLSDRMPRLNRDQPMVYNLQSKDILFCKMLLENKIIETILKHFLNDRWFSSLPKDTPNYILRSFLARSSNYEMPMHIDSFVPYTGSHCFIMQCSILLEDQSRENGCTVLVPKSHLSGEYAPQESRRNGKHLEGKAGDLVFWDSRIWHGAGANATPGTRWSMIATFCRWWIKQAFDIPGNLPQSIYDELTDAQRAIMGFCSVPYDSEIYGIDMKRSFDLLPERVEDYRR